MRRRKGGVAIGGGQTVSEDNNLESPTGTSDFLWEVHRYTNEYIRFADTKAGFIAGVSAALVGSLVASSLFDSCFRTTLCQWSKLQWTELVPQIQTRV